MSVDVVGVTRLDELAAHAEAWDALSVEAQEGLPSLSHAWVAPVLEHRLPAGTTWWVGVALDGGQAVGVLPALVRGRRLVAPRDTDTGVLSWYPLAAPGREPEVMAALHAAALEATGARSAELAGVRADAQVHVPPGTAAFRSAPRPGSVLPTDGGLAAVEDRWGSNLRRNLRKAAHRAEREGAAYRFLEGDEAKDPGLLATYLRLEAAGWKGRAGTAVAQDAGLVRYYEALTARLAERGWLQWHLLELQGEVAAMHLAVRSGRSMVLSRIAYDEAWKRLGPGSLLLRELVARCCDDPGVLEVDCLTDMEWHDTWGMDERQRTDVLLVPRRPLPLARGVLGTALPQAVRRTAKEHPALVAAVRRLRR